MVTVGDGSTEKAVYSGDAGEVDEVGEHISSE